MTQQQRAKQLTRKKQVNTKKSDTLEGACDTAAEGKCKTQHRSHRRGFMRERLVQRRVCVCVCVQRACKGVRDECNDLMTSIRMKRRAINR